MADALTRKKRSFAFGKALVCIILSSVSGMFAGGLAATPYFAFLNWRASDGPYFPPPLVALVVVSALALLILPFQIAALVWRRVKSQMTVRGAGLLGALAGVAAGAIFARIALAGGAAGAVLVYIGLGLIQGSAALTSLAWLGRRWSGDNPYNES